jgi:anaerobic selenocysteine-containing dehydrogenase
MIDQALDSRDPLKGWLDGIDRARLEREKSVKMNFHNGGTETQREADSGNPPRLRDSVVNGFFLPFANGFLTPSGKAELYSEKLKAMGLDPIVAFVPPRESRHTEAAQRYPLEMLARKADNFLNSTFCNVPAVQAMEERGLVELNRADAEARGIAEGDRVRVFNARGALHLVAHVNGAVQPGVVAARLNWAKLSTDGINVNVLTNETLTDIGRGPTFYSCLVEVEKA